jgi:hypothetical protein
MPVEWELFDHKTGKPLGTVYAGDTDDLTRIVQSRYGDRAVQANPVTSKKGQFGLGALQDTLGGMGALVDFASRAPAYMQGRRPATASLARLGERAGGGLARMLGINVTGPQDQGQMYARAAGRATGSLPLVAATGGMATPGLAAANTAGAFAGEFASQAAANAGAGAAMQTGAGIAADLLATKGAGMGLRRIPGMAAGLGGKPGTFVPSRMQQKVFEKLAPLDILDKKSGDLMKQLSGRYGVLDDIKEAAWRKVPVRGVASVPGNDLVSAARKIVSDETASDLTTIRPPAFLRRLANRVDSSGNPRPIRFEDLRAAEKEVTALVRQAGKADASEVVRQQAAMARKLSDAIGQTLVTMEQSADGPAVTALQEARASSKMLATQFDRQDAIYRKAIDPASLLDDPHRSIEAIVKSRHGNKLSKTLRDIAGGTPAGEQALRGAFVDVSSGTSAKGFSATSTLKFLEEYETVGRNMMGDPAFDHYRNVMRELADVSTKNQRTFAHRLAMYAGYASAGAAAAGGRVASAAGGATASSVLEAIGQRLATDNMTIVARKALVDRDLFLLMKQAPTARNVARAQLWVDALVIRGTLRAGESEHRQYR